MKPIIERIMHCVAVAASDGENRLFQANEVNIVDICEIIDSEFDRSWSLKEFHGRCCSPWCATITHHIAEFKIGKQILQFDISKFDA